jgi:glycine oxidase
MAAEWDAIVVGAGIIGCAIGRELARRGQRTAIIEARGVAAGATQASAGVLAPFIEAPTRGPLHDLTVRSLAMYDGFVADLERETGQRIEYRRLGTLEVAAGAEGRARLLALAQAARAEGMDARWVSGADLRALESQLSAQDGALLVSDHGYVVVAQLAQTLIEAAGRYGADLLRERVEHIEARGSRVDVTTTAGVRRASTVVVAAGSWSQTLTRDGPPVKPIRGQLVRLVWKGPPLNHILWGERCYIVPWKRGTVLVGATVEDVGFDERATVAGVRELVDAATELVPHSSSASFVEVRVGLRPATPDGLPIIGRSAESPAIVHATGHYRNGILLTPLTAQLVGDLVVKGESDPALEAISPARFQRSSA